MKKLMNDAEAILTESLSGFAAAHADLVSVSRDPAYVVRAEGSRPGKVALISGGGSGHEPLHAGFVGHGMLDAACPGQVFTSPTPDQMMAAAEALAGHGGILWIVKNYTGDIMNFEMAAEMVEGTATVVIADDVAVENSTFTTGRRGVAGTVIVEKLAGAAAEAGADLEACRRIAEAAATACGTMGVALSSCTVPAAGTPTFSLADDEMEMGVGIHGEPGRRRVKLAGAAEIADEMIATILGDLTPAAGAPLAVIVNGFGATPAMELYVVFDAVARNLAGRGHGISRSLVGNHVTSLEMAGCSITLAALDEAQLGLWDAPVHTAGLRWGR